MFKEVIKEFNHFECLAIPNLTIFFQIYMLRCTWVSTKENTDGIPSCPDIPLYSWEVYSGVLRITAVPRWTEKQDRWRGSMKKIRDGHCTWSYGDSKSGMEPRRKTRRAKKLIALMLLHRATGNLVTNFPSLYHSSAFFWPQERDVRTYSLSG